MQKKFAFQRYFAVKDIQISVALIVVWSLVAVVIFTMAARAFGLFVDGFGVFSFLIILLGYAGIIILLTLVFTHRLIGPFERLNKEIDHILEGNYDKRLMVRERDDLTIRTFVNHVNKIIEELDETRRWNDYCYLQIQAQLSGMVAKCEREELREGEIKELFSTLNEKINTLIKEHRK